MQYTPHPGPQTWFHETTAFECLFGGAAGPGKSLSLLMEGARDIDHPDHRAIIFRKSFPQLEGSDGLIETSKKYFLQSARYVSMPSRKWTFPSGSTFRFGHMSNKDDHLNHQGQQYTYVGYDELAAFSEEQYLYLFSRIRTTAESGIDCKMRAATNPPEDYEPGAKWIKKRWGPWLDKNHPNPAQPRELRWYVRGNDGIEREVPRDDPDPHKWSRTFIPGRFGDNPSLDPNYERNLNMLPYIQRRRLKEGDWDIKAAAGKVFNKNWFQVAANFPPITQSAAPKFVRFWDTAATEKKLKSKDPDYTASCLACLIGGRFYIKLMRDRISPAAVTKWIKATALAEPGVEGGGEQEPGSQSKIYLDNLISELGAMNRVFRAYKTSRSKVDRASVWSAQAEAGHVTLVTNSALDNDEVLDELHSFPDGPHDDMVDAISGAWQMLMGGTFEFVMIGGDGVIGASNTDVWNQNKSPFGL